TMRADGADVLHLPWPSLVAVCARGKCADGADVNAHAALFALEVVFFIRRDDRARSAVVNAQSPDIHALSADADAAVAQNASRTVEIHHRRPLLLVAMVLKLDELRLGRAVLEGHVLKFALATGVAHRTIERMVAEQQLQHGLSRLLDLVAFSGDDHALCDRSGAGGLQLGHLLDFDQAHAARALERQARVVAEGRHLDARALAGFNEERPRGNGKLLAVNSKGYVSHGETAVRSSPFANGNSILLSSRARTSVRVEGSAFPYRP